MAERSRVGSWRVSRVMVVGLACLIACAFAAARFYRACKQREAVEAITRSGGKVWYGFEYDGKAFQEKIPEQPPVRVWLSRWVGKDFVEDVLEASVRTDAGLEVVGDLPQLEGLDLWFSDATDRGLANLKALKRLRILSLEATKITDGSLKHVAALPRLERLVLADTAVTDTGLEFLRSSTHLEYINLEGTHVTPEGVRRLSQALPNCEIITKFADSPTVDDQPE
jgi:hypothetical protein